MKSFAIRLVEEGQCLTAATSATGASNAVHIVFVGRRDVEVDDVRNVGDVNAARRHVSRNQYLNTSVLKQIQRALAIVLRFVSVNGFCLDALILEHLGELLNTVLRASEDNDATKVRLCKHLVQHVDFITSLNANNILVNGARSVRGLYGNAHRILEEVCDYPFDVGRNRRGEEERVTICRQVRHNPTHVMNESHIKHAIRLVEHDLREVSEVERFAFDEVLQATRGADNEVWVATQAVYLTTNVHATDTGNRVEMQITREPTELVFDLYGELASRHHDNGAHLVIAQSRINKRNKKRRGLSGSRVSNTYDIFALKDMRNSTILNRCWRHVSLVTDVLLQIFDDKEVREVVFGYKDSNLFGNRDFVDKARGIDVLGTRATGALATATTTKRGARASATAERRTRAASTKWGARASGVRTAGAGAASTRTAGASSVARERWAAATTWWPTRRVLRHARALSRALSGCDPHSRYNLHCFDRRSEDREDGRM